MPSRLPAPCAVAAVLAALALSPFASTRALAQTAGNWHYTIATDPSNIPADMRVNFPTIAFDVCRTTEDFASGRAFALQTLESSASRCPSAGFRREPLPDGKGESMTFVYACDEGKTLSGLARGTVRPSAFSISLESRYSPPVGGVEIVRQTMTGARTGACR